MSDANATVVETPIKAGESRVERPHATAESALESGDVSGVYRIAQQHVDETVTRELGISKIDDAQTAAVAGPEIIALKQADAEFGNRAQAALGGLKEAIGGVKTETEAEREARLEAVAAEAMKSGPLTVEEMAEDLEKHVTPEEAVNAIPLTIKREDPVITVEELKPEEQEEVKEVAALAELDEDIERGVKTFEAELQKIDAELTAEKKAIEEFNASHGAAHTKLEQAYLDALTNRITALEFEKKTHETNDQSFEAKAKAAELKQLAEKAEASYQEMYNSHMNQPVAAAEQPSEKSVLHLNEEDEQFEARQYEQFHPGNTFGTSKSGGSGSFDANPMGMAPNQPKQKGRMGKFVDSLKFWRYLTGKQQ